VGEIKKIVLISTLEFSKNEGMARNGPAFFVHVSISNHHLLGLSEGEE
jgi:hypothetical protein